MTKSGNVMLATQKAEVKTRLGTFEVVSAIVDSGAAVPFMHPSTGATYMKTKLKITQRVWYLGAANGLPAYQAFESLLL